jgi:hypothetical protein
MWVYHGEDNTALLDNALKAFFGHAAQVLEGVTSGQRTVGIHETQCLFGGDMPLKVAGHSEAHGAETELRNDALASEWWECMEAISIRTQPICVVAMVNDAPVQTDLKGDVVREVTAFKAESQLEGRLS